MRFTFGKKEKLCSRKTLAELFAKGKSENHYPVRIVWMEMEKEDDIYARVAVSVSKRSFKRALDRNRIKRLMREAYRNNKSMLEEFCKSRNTTLAILFIYTGKELPEYMMVQAKIILSLKRFQDYV